MINRLLLNQARKGIKALIAENPEAIIIQGKAFTDNGFGGEVQDPFGIPIPDAISCRIRNGDLGSNPNSSICGSARAWLNGLDLGTE